MGRLAFIFSEELEVVRGGRERSIGNGSMKWKVRRCVLFAWCHRDRTGIPMVELRLDSDNHLGYRSETIQGLVVDGCPAN